VSILEGDDDEGEPAKFVPVSLSRPTTHNPSTLTQRSWGDYNNNFSLLSLSLFALCIKNSIESLNRLPLLLFWSMCIVRQVGSQDESISLSSLSRVKHTHTLWFIIQLFHYCRTKRHIQPRELRVLRVESHESGKKSITTRSSLSPLPLSASPGCHCLLSRGNFFCSRTQ
jgi:hypothetical protein